MLKRLKWILLALFIVNIFLRLPALLQDHYPFTFCDEDIVSYNSYRVYYDKNWSPGQFLYGGVNYYTPAIVANVYSFLTGHRISLADYMLLGRFIFAVFIAAGFVPLLFLATENLLQNRAISWFVSLIATFSPMALGTSRIAYPDHYVITFSTLVLLACSQILLPSASENQKNRWTAIAGFAVGCSIGVKYYSILFALPLLITHGIRMGNGSSPLDHLKWTLSSRTLWIAGLLCIGGFLFTNPYVLFESNRFLKDFKTNVANYNGGIQGGYSDWGAWLYAQYVFLTSFGVLGGMLIVLGLKNLARTDRSKMFLLFSFPVFFILFLGRYKTNIARNMMPALPFVFILQSTGLFYLLNVVQLRKRFFRALILALVLSEPLFKVGASLRNDFLPDSRKAARTWIAENLPLDAKIAFTQGGWGIPIPPEFKVVQIPYSTELPPNECIPYYVLDRWIAGTFSTGIPMYFEPIYWKIHFNNASQHYPVAPPLDPISREKQILSQFKLIQKFAEGYYGPGIEIYKRVGGCPLSSSMDKSRR